jgi:hypothetical protein
MRRASVEARFEERRSNIYKTYRVDGFRHSDDEAKFQPMRHLAEPRGVEPLTS